VEKKRKKHRCNFQIVYQCMHCGKVITSFKVDHSRRGTLNSDYVNESLAERNGEIGF